MTMSYPWTSKIFALAALGALAALPAAALGWQDKVDPSVLQAAALGDAEFLVHLAEQADLSGAAALATKEEKGAWVYAQLTATAAATQAPLLAELASLGASARSFWIVNTIWAQGSLAAVQAMASRPEVARVYASGWGTLETPAAESAAATAAATVEPNLSVVRAPEVWALGVTGEGVVVAGADTGVEWDHPALVRQYRGSSPTGVVHDYNWHLGANPHPDCPDPATPCDDDSHGSHTMGTIVGDDGAGNQIGMAPDADWIACRNMNFGFGTVPSYLDCMEWMMAPTDLAGQNPDPAKAPHVINNSWACAEACPPPLLEEQLDASRAAGIVYVVSAGNFGPACSTILFPLAVYEGAFNVGATNNADAIASFSSRGPILLNPPNLPRREPDVVAPGVGVRSSVPGGAYGNKSGTSMSGPHVAGLVALMISANPALAGQVERIEELITQTVMPLTTGEGCGGDTADQVPNNTFGWGRIDALAAVEAAGREPRPCSVIDDADPAIEYRHGWHRRDDGAASAGGYHRRMGAHNGSAAHASPTARVVFEGDSVSYFYATSEVGGTADVFIDGELRETVSYGANQPAPDRPSFGATRTWDGLGDGEHELEISYRSGAVYVDGFAFNCDEGGSGADAGAAAFRSLTAVSTATASEGPLVTRTVEVGAADEELSVVVEGSSLQATVRLRDPAGGLLAEGGALLGGLAASGLDAAVAGAGSYTVEVLALPGTYEVLEISTARTVRVE